MTGEVMGHKSRGESGGQQEVTGALERGEGKDGVW